MIPISREIFTQQILNGYTVKDLQKYWECSRTTVYEYKRKWNLVGKSPNNVKRCHDDGIKTCGICLKPKTLGNFYSNGYYPSGSKKYKPNCKDCENTKVAKEKYKKINTILHSMGKKYECENCGYKENYAALCFHHPNEDKEVSISRLSKSSSLEVLRSEISKCIMLCHNCHMEEHYPHLNR